jgi:hypothetical protein
MVAAMPDDPKPTPVGTLTPEQQQKALAWLQARWGLGRGCPFHDTPTNWQIGDSMIQTLPFAGGGVVIGGPTYPLFPVICMTCGHTVFINAVVAGIVEAQPPPAEPSSG